jgi:hypothetical protein
LAVVDLQHLPLQHLLLEQLLQLQLVAVTVEAVAIHPQLLLVAEAWVLLVILAQKVAVQLVTVALEYQQAFLVLLFSTQQVAVVLLILMVQEELVVTVVVEMVARAQTQVTHQVPLVLQTQVAEAVVLHTQPTALTEDMVMLVVQAE